MSKKTITKFTGEYAFLSNFYPSPTCPPTVEHQYQALKTTDPKWKAKIIGAKTAGEAKRIGRKCPLRPDWDLPHIKEQGMLGLLRMKFEKDSLLLEKLLQTGDAFLIEGNDWGDRYWGKTWSTIEKNWVGENRLGQLLMMVRAGIQAEKEEKEEQERFREAAEKEQDQ